MAAERPTVPTADPRGFMPLVGRLWLRAMGWRLDGALPSAPRYVLIVAPHTTNADFFVGLAAKWALGLRAKWLGKHTLFRGPLGWLLRALGGIPVDRSHPDGTVEAVLADMEAAPTFVLALAPEGTRRLTEGWKTGFYRIAAAARVPILPVAFDWSSRKILLRTLFQPTGELGEDVSRLRAMYHKGMARHPGLFNDIHDELPSGAR